MGPRAHERQFGIGQLVEQEPVGLDGAVPVPDPLTAQRMRTAPVRERLLFLGQDVLSLLANPLQIPLKRRGREERESH